MNERIKKIRLALKLTQDAFSQKLGVKRNTIGNYETGNRAPSNQTIFSICREFNVNEDWLRHGTGEMFVLTQDEELATLQKKYNLDSLDIKIVKAYLKLSPDSRNVFKNYFNTIFGSEIANEEEKINLDVESYRKELGGQNRFSTSEVSTNIKENVS